MYQERYLKDSYTVIIDNTNLIDIPDNFIRFGFGLARCTSKFQAQRKQPLPHVSFRVVFRTRNDGA